MATTYSVQKTAWDQTTPKALLKPNEQGGRVRVAYALAEASALAVGPIEMFNLPDGARVLSGELVHDALGGSTTLSVGHAAYTDSSGATVALDVVGDLRVVGDVTFEGISKNITTTDESITLSKDGSLATIGGAGIDIEANGVTRAYVRGSNSRNGWSFQEPLCANVLNVTISANKTSAILAVFILPFLLIFQRHSI